MTGGLPSEIFSSFGSTMYLKNMSSPTSSRWLLMSSMYEVNACTYEDSFSGLVAPNAVCRVPISCSKEAFSAAAFCLRIGASCNFNASSTAALRTPVGKPGNCIRLFSISSAKLGLRIKYET
jgi:hypothetical protein